MDNGVASASERGAFAHRLRQLRLARGLTQEELSERAGLSVRAISDLERGLHRAPRKDTVALLTQGLELSNAEHEALEATIGPRSRYAAFRRVRTDLPTMLTPFIGREREVAALSALVRDDQVRLVVLTGPGGVGKTRLALKVAQALRDEGLESVFVPLAATPTSALVLPTLSAALGIRENGERPLVRRLTEELQPLRLLLILDNFERLTAEAPLVADILAACPSLTVLATSRTILGISGEQIFPVPPMTLPDGFADESALSASVACRAEAIRLFVARARASQPDFTLTDANAGAVASICARLDGLPLAIELAASLVRHFPPPALAARLTNRLPLLTGGPKDQPERLQTMANAIAWSYDLLSPAEQASFRRLSVFVGGLTLEAAEWVIGDGLSVMGEHDGPSPITHHPSPVSVVAGITSLIDKSLLSPREVPDGEPRFRMLETIREFGRERLAESGEESALRIRHAHYVLAFVEQAEREINGPHQGLWMKRLDVEIGNVRAALTWSLHECDALGVVGLRTAAALWRYWLSRGLLSEGIGWLNRALTVATGAPAGIRAKGLNGQGNLELELSNIPAADKLYRASLELFRETGDQEGIAKVLNNLGLVLECQGELTSARASFEGSLAIRRALQERTILPITLSNLCRIAIAQDDADAAERFGDEALDVSREALNVRGLTYACLALGIAAFHRGRDDVALRWFEEGLQYARSVDDLPTQADFLRRLGRVAVRQRRLRDGGHLIAESLSILREMGSRWGVAECLDAMAEAAEKEHRLDIAARLTGAAAALWEELGVVLPPVLRSAHLKRLDSLRLKLGDGRFDAELRAGRRMTFEEMVAEALRFAEAADDLADQFPAVESSAPWVQPPAWK